MGKYKLMKVENSSKLNYGNLLFLFLTPPLSVLLGIWYIYENGLHIADILIFFSMYILTGMSITAGYHRCFSHKSYECHGIIKFFFLAFGAAAFENSAVEWCSDHRVHHKYSDKELDPYNPKKGFFWAHMGWILYHDKPDTSYSTIPDLLKSKLIMFQHRYYLPIAISFSFLLPFLIGMTYDRAFGALLFGGLLRLVFTHHSTFLINSAAHFFGKRTYCSNSSARDNWLLAIFTFGEGYHNFHHKFPADFRNGITRFSFDPTKWLIQVLSFLKLSWKLKETPEWSILRAKFQVQYDKLSQTIDLLPQNLHLLLVFVQHRLLTYGWFPTYRCPV